MINRSFCWSVVKHVQDENMKISNNSGLNRMMESVEEKTLLYSICIHWFKKLSVEVHKSVHIDAVG